MLGEHPAIAALEAGRRGLQRRPADFELDIGNLKRDRPRGGVDRDHVAGIDECHRAANEGLR